MWVILEKTLRKPGSDKVAVSGLSSAKLAFIDFPGISPVYIAARTSFNS
jgi:hypothetical protein